LQKKYLSSYFFLNKGEAILKGNPRAPQNFGGKSVNSKTVRVIRACLPAKGRFLSE
jgi:hypothetical protein